MRCPKCDHVQLDAVECEACGVIFAKYRKIQERLKEAEENVSDSAGKSSAAGLKILPVLLLVVAVAATTYYFTASRNQPVSQPPVETAKVSEAPPPQVRSEPAEETASPQVESVQLVYRGNTIENARNATVSIEAPWGTGSGFFVDKNYIVTNRHVVQFDDTKLAEFRQKVETGRELIRLEQQKIGEMRAQLQRLPKGPSRSQLAIIIDAHEDNLQKILPKQEEGEKRLANVDRKIQPSDIKIVLADGSQHEANYLLVSDTYDLALMSLYSGDRTYIERAPAGLGLHQGDKVFAIGSPIGLRHTVTSGIFSSFRTKDGQVYLQTDAAINPGNSGGPLIDENGYARGVTTMILRDTEGIGFAIPIEKVFEEFRGTLY
jgi:S1-C subfamily serine protease